MPRNGNIRPRVISEEYCYSSRDVAKFINLLMVKGKKRTAERITYSAIETLEKYIKEKEFHLDSDSFASLFPLAENQKTSLGCVGFFQALANVAPFFEVRARRVGGATYSIPVELSLEARRSMAMRTLIRSARKRVSEEMQTRLARELFDALNGRGEAFKKKEEIHKVARANQAFLYFRWRNQVRKSV